MTQLQPDVLYDRRYDTKSTCSKLGIGRSTLIRYRKAGLIKASYHRANLRPYYTGYEIMRLWNMTA